MPHFNIAMHRALCNYKLQDMSKKQTGKAEPGSPPKQPPCDHSPEAQAAREQEAVDQLNRDNIHQYLRGLEVTGLTEQMARSITRTSADKIAQGLRKGLLEIPRHPPTLPDHTAHRLTSEEARQQQERERREDIARRIDYLCGQARGESPAGDRGTLQVDFKEVLTKEQHERRVKEMAQERADRKRRAAEQQEQEERRRREEEEHTQAMLKLEEERERELKRARIQQKLQRRKEENQKAEAQEAQLRKELASAKNQSRLYAEMEKRYESQVLLPSLEQRKTKLKEIRDFHKRYDVETIRDHEKTYLQHSQEKSKERTALSPRWDYHPPARTDRLSKLLRDEEAMLKEQLEAPRKKLEEMQKRQELYRLELKQKHQPIVDEDKRREVEERLIKEQRKHERSHPDIDKRKLGEAYLEIAKRMRRPQSEKQQEEESEEQLLKQEPPAVVARAEGQGQDGRRRRLEGLARQEKRSVGERCLLLRMQAEKLEERMRQKEELARCQHDPEAKHDAAQLLLSSITAKMGIIDLLHPAHTHPTHTHSSH